MNLNIVQLRIALYLQFVMKNVNSNTIKTTLTFNYNIILFRYSSLLLIRFLYFIIVGKIILYIYVAYIMNIAYSL